MTRTDPRSHQDVIAAAQSLGPAYDAIAAAARVDPAVFCQFVLKTEENGEPIELASMHEEWHDLLSKHERVVLWTFTGAGKTNHLSIGRVLYEIGRNPNIRILILSSASGMAKKIVKSIKSYIENSAEYRMVFPAVVPDKSDTTGAWREDSFIVQRRTKNAKDPTVQARGYGGNVLGSRVDLIVIDDYLTDENTFSDTQRNKYYGWLKSTIEGRKADSTRLWFIGNAWHPDDAMHRYAGETATFSKKYPIIEGGVSAWPAMWTPERIEKEISNRGPIESRRSMFCDPLVDADRRFKLDFIKNALFLGDPSEMAASLRIVPNGWGTYTGVDVAVTKKSSGDEAAIVTIASELNPPQRNQIINIEAGRWGGPELVERIRDVHHRYGSQVWVESNGVQQMLKQFLVQGTSVPVRAFFTGRNKYDPAFGIASLATEMGNGKWYFPNHGGETRGLQADMDPELRKLIDEMIRYDPVSHTGDRLMALWIAREGRRMGASPAGIVKRRAR
jgi:hypothetical protein